MIWLFSVVSFAAQNNEELSFVKGERLEILDRPPADPDWYRARNTLGSIGLIPKNYVQVFICSNSNALNVGFTIPFYSND